MNKKTYAITAIVVTLLILSPIFYSSLQQSKASLLFLKDDKQKSQDKLETTFWNQNSQTAYLHYLLTNQTDSLQIAIEKNPHQYTYINKVVSDIGFDGVPKESFNNTSSSFCLFLTQKALEECRSKKKEDILKGLALAVQARNIHKIPETDYAIGEICRQYYKAYYHAYDSFLTSLRQKPTYPTYWYHLGYVFNSAKCHQGYISCYCVNTRLNPDSVSIQTSIASILSRSGYNNEAIHLLHYLLEEFPNNTQIYYSLGSIYRSNKAPDKAEQYYLEATYLFPEDPKTYYELGNFFYSQKEYRKALLQHTKALGLAKSQDKNISAWWWYRKGLDFFQLKDFNGAVLALKEAKKISESSSFDYWLGRSFDENQNYTEAVHFYSEYLEKNPLNDSVIFLRAKSYAKMGNYEEAINDVKQVIELKPSNNNYKRHYTEWLELLSDHNM